MTRIDDPYVMSVRDAGFDEGRPYLVMDLIEGAGDLDAWIRARQGAGEVGGEVALELCRRVAQGVAALHEAGVIHRDLKPANVLVDAQGSPRVTDLGIAKTREDSGIRTSTGVVLGTPGFVGPEVLQGRLLTPAADVYALGVIFSYALSGELPFSSKDPQEILREQLRGLSLVRFGGLPGTVARLLAQMTDRDPAVRPPISEVRAVLGKAAWEDDEASVAATRVLVSGARPTAPPEKAPPPRGLGPGGLALGLLGLAILGALAPWPGGAPQPPPAPPGPSRDERIAVAVGRLGDYSYRGLLGAVYGAQDPDAGATKLMKSAGEPWRREGRAAVAEALRTAPWYPALEDLRGEVTPEWWAATGEAGADRGLRTRVMERVQALGWLDHLDRRQRGPGDLVGLQGLLEPAVRVRPLLEFGDHESIPGLESWDARCRVLASHPDSEFMDGIEVMGKRMLGTMCDFDPAQISIERQVRIRLGGAPPAASPLRTVALGVYDHVPESLLEIAPLDAEGRALAHAVLHLPTLPDRFGGQGESIDDIFATRPRYPLIVQVAFRRELVGDGPLTLRLRYRNLVTAYDTAYPGYVLVTGAGVLAAPLATP